MINLPLCRYRVRFRAQDAGLMRAFAGSAWRGAFGAGLKRTVCAMRLRPCGGCPLRDGCTYPYLFEGHRPAGTPPLSAFDNAPVPFRFDPPPAPDREFAAGDRLAVSLTLVGRANRHLPYVIRALALAGEGGIGPTRARLALEAVEHLDRLDGDRGTKVFASGDEACSIPDPRPPDPWVHGRTIGVRLLTPLRIRIAQDLVTPDRFEPRHLIEAAVRRLSALAAIHADAPVAADYRGLKARAAQVRLADARLRWSEQVRFSARQGQRMQMGGLVGTCVLDFVSGTEDLIAWLDAGQWVGAGKGASMGLGSYRIAPAVEHER